MNAWILGAYCIVICCQFLCSYAATQYEVELVFAMADPATIRQNVTQYLRAKNIDVYVENITISQIT